jgi:manganese-dependent inorganic pyrophosphatase
MRLPIYVIGHVNPDTDSIAAAIGYAWLLKSRDNADVIAARSVVINQQTSWLLNYLGLEIPFLLSTILRMDSCEKLCPFNGIKNLLNILIYTCHYNDLLITFKYNSE